MFCEDSRRLDRSIALTFTRNIEACSDFCDTGIYFRISIFVRLHLVVTSVYVVFFMPVQPGVLDVQF